MVVGDEAKVMGIISERDADFTSTSAMDVAHTTLIWWEVTATVAVDVAKLLPEPVPVDKP